MYRLPSKRKQLLQRAAVYTLMTLAVVGLVTLLIFFTLGYRYNQDDGVVQTGLVQFGSKPSGAQVVIDDTSFGSRTPSKTSLAAGQHAISMQRDGYRQWQKSVDVVGGAVLWLNYARLIPTDLDPSNVASFNAVSSTAVSPDARQMLVAEDPASATLRLINLTDDKIKPVALQLPANLYTAPAEGESQRFELTKWDSSNRYVIVKHTHGGSHEWLVVDTRDVGSSQNITRLLGINASQLVFGNGTNSILYALVDDTVRRVDRGSATISRPLVKNVETFSLYDSDTVVFTERRNEETNKRGVGYYLASDDKTYQVGAYTEANDAPRIAIGQYFGDTYIAVAHGGKVAVSMGDLGNPDEWQEITTMELGGVKHLSIVTAGRFVIAQTDDSYVVYDLELKKLTTTTLRGTGLVTEELRWLDGYTVWSDRGGMVRLYEFDGANQQDIMKVAPGYSVTLSPDGQYLYGITKSGDRFHLTRVKLIVS